VVVVPMAAAVVRPMLRRALRHVHPPEAVVE
jgi:hypothetical protein